jgi:hypothetical protein
VLVRARWPALRALLLDSIELRPRGVETLAVLFAPLRELTLGTGAAGLRTCATLGELRRLVVRDNRIGPRDVEALLENVRLPALRSFEWQGIRGRNTLLRAYLAGHLPRLRELQAFDPRPERVLELAGCAHLTGLARLHVEGLKATPELVQALAASKYLRDVGHVRLVKPAIPPEGRAALAAALGDGLEIVS